ncbi:MAG: DUF47 family protein [Candidatus Cloacimonetes bacterium]|nr:DUF47 family protein [Candidatus Cloacimonadota bacterium]
MNTIFSSKTKRLEAEIEGFLDRVSTAGLVFEEGVKCYINVNPERFEEYNTEIHAIESEADRMRRDIKHQLYTYMLIPESRGDVLGLLETLDDVIDICEKVLEQFSVEMPDIPPTMQSGFIELATLSTQAVEQLVKGARAFFKEIKMVNDYINKVHFYEHEADKMEEQLKRMAFRTSEISEFSKRVHMRYFIEKIAAVSDIAETVSERLAVYAIKRRL